MAGLLSCRPARKSSDVQLAAHDDAPLGEAHLLPNLVVQIPACAGDGRRDVLAADVAFGQAFLVDQN